MVKYQELWNEENTNIRERYDLAIERIMEIPSEERVGEPYRSYFNQMAAFTSQIDELARIQLREDLDALTLEELKQLNHNLYADILPGHYAESYADPAYAVRMLGAELGPLLSAFYAQFRAAIVFAYECRLTDITILCETLIEIYNMFEDGEPQARAVRDVLYWFFSDYTDVTLTYRIREQLDPGLSFAKDIIQESDLNDLRYLYRFGEYISESELQIATYLNSLPEETIEKMASTYTEGYRKGFETMGRDLSKKKTVSIRYELGFERMIRSAIRQFEEMGLEVILYRAAVWSVTMSPNRRIGYHGTSANMQFDYLKKKAAAGESFVIVGRCSETILKGFDGLVTIFVLGDPDVKAERIRKVYGVSEEEARRMMKREDWNRKSYHNYYCKGKWGDSRNYDFSINSSRLGIEKTVDMLENCIRARMESNC